MSVLQYPEGIDATVDLQIWNNAAFDDRGNSEDFSAKGQSWGSLKSIFGNPKASLDSVSGKENQDFDPECQISSVSSYMKPSVTPFKPVNTDLAMEKSRIKGVLKKSVEENVALKVEGIQDEKKIDEEIEEIESEISRLTLRLEALKLEKTKKAVKSVEKAGRVVPTKFMEQKKSVKNEDDKKKIEGISSATVRPRVRSWGLSLGPAEIASVGRRGISMGPSEIFGSVKSRQLDKQEMITPAQNRRKSCFWKLQHIDEEKVAAKSSSVSPRSRKVAARTQVLPRNAVTTVSSRKTLKKEGEVIKSVQPRKLFKDGEKAAPATSKKPLRPGRVVASRYNQGATQASAMKKRSLPENDKDDSKRCEKKRSLEAEKPQANAAENRNLGTESRVKKRWEVPTEIIVHSSLEAEENSPESVVRVPDLLPKIRIARCTKEESPRDSGPAKKAVELIGRKSYFCNNEQVEPSVCQALTYAE